MRPIRSKVTIDAPDHPRLRVDTSHKYSTSKRSSNMDNPGLTPAEETGPASGRFPRARSGTISSMKHWASSENEATPYLSWQPTIGRNSAFVDLTEEQREELGGIEYRSLKTLAVVLVCEICIRPLFEHELTCFHGSVLHYIPYFGRDLSYAMDITQSHLGPNCR